MPGWRNWQTRTFEGRVGNPPHTSSSLVPGTIFFAKPHGSIDTGENDATLEIAILSTLRSYSIWGGDGFFFMYRWFHLNPIIVEQ